jgi:hypothetical protein
MIKLIFDYYDKENKMQRVNQESKTFLDALSWIEYYIREYDNVQVTFTNYGVEGE